MGKDTVEVFRAEGGGGGGFGGGFSIRPASVSDPPEENKEITMPRRAIVFTERNYPSVQEYLGRDVAAVEIPRGCRKPDGNMDYPPFILDGASGVGKTQQAFALLKQHGNLFYVVLAKSNQPIYKSMGLLCGNFYAFRTVSEACMERARGQVGPNEDPFSTANLLGLFLEGGLREMLVWLVNASLSTNVDSDGTAHLYVGVDGDVETFDLGDFERILRDKILFLDEALPGKTADTADKELLRFVRNCGRVLSMRVVPAGTATVAANLVARVGQFDASREVPEESFCWAACHFLWKPMRETEINAYSDAISRLLPATVEEVRNVLLMERPLLVHLLLRKLTELLDTSPAGTNFNTHALLTNLVLVGRILCVQKGIGFSSGLKTIWLSGAWLAEKKGWSTSPHNIRGPDMVRGHFFEPAIVSLVNGMPRLQGGIARLENVPGPLTATLYHIAALDTNVDHPVWVLSTESPESSHATAAAAETFDSVHAALSSCVQQCLAREPLLAIALSTQHRLSERDFKKGITECFQTSHAEFSLGHMSGENLENVVYAALQLANGGNILETVNIPDYCKELARYLSPNASGEQVVVNESVLSSFGIPPLFCVPAKHTEAEIQYDIPAVAYNEAMKRRNESNTAVLKYNADLKEGEPQKHVDHTPIPSVHEAEHLALGTKIPWLIPSSTAKVLNESSLGGLRNLFNGAGIAALVPGLTNAACDIDAYEWPPCSIDSDVLLWKFEVKGRSTQYSMTDGVKDIVKKCGDEGHSDGQHHAMLIAVRGQWETQTRVWAVEKNGKRYLRVVLLLSGL